MVDIVTCGKGGFVLEGAKYNLIYEYYKCNILFGRLLLGSCLPSIEQIGAVFQVAPQTVRNALMKLQDEQLISVSPGRNTVVVYETTPGQSSLYMREYYLARRDAIREVYEVSDVLLMPIYREGCRRLTDKDLSQLLDTAEQEGCDIASLSMLCCNMMLEKLHNWLVKSLYLDMLSFFLFPNMASLDKRTSEEYRNCHELLLSGCKAQDRDRVFAAFTGFQELIRKMLLSYNEAMTSDIPLPEQIPFCWSTYRGRPQHCHTLAADIIHQIVEGKYTQGDMLPSYDVMAEEFAVSLNTARRSVSLLRDMGLINSINGVGKQIAFTEPDPERISRLTIQNNTDMAVESMEILLISAEHIVSKCFPLLTEEQTAVLKRILFAKNRRHPLECVILIAEYVTYLYPSDTFFEIYRKLLEPLLLTYPLLLGNTTHTDKVFEGYIRELDRALDLRDAGRFSGQFVELLRYVREETGLIR